MISAKILADSINPAGVRLTSWLLTYPRFIHSEFMTHRVFSRNAASSRARPMGKTIEAVRNNPALPVWWGAEQKGMASGDQLPPEEMEDQRAPNGELCQLGVTSEWLAARTFAASMAQRLSNRGLHKSLCNRLIEPFDHMTCIATATDHRNFFGLRAHPAAMPEFQALAYMMLREYRKNAPRALRWGDWHIPNFGEKPFAERTFDQEQALKIAVARCARLSYLTFDGEFSIEKDLELFERLKGPPMHASPFEHVAQAVDPYDEPYPVSNFDQDGTSYWRQYRKLFKNEHGMEANLDHIAATEPEWVTKLIEAQ